MPRVFDDRADPRVTTAYPRAFTAYAVICAVAVIFIIVSALVGG
jgi:hypothetical protein